MALGSANTSAQARGKNKPVKIKRSKEVGRAKNWFSFVATAITGESSGAGACPLRSSMAFDKVYYVSSMTDGKPDIGTRVYSSQRSNSKFLLEEGVYLFKVSGANDHYLTINSERFVGGRASCR